MSEVKPIETEYNGYRFRSRLEARWAVFFDEAKIQYRYEPEGYKLSDGTKYLPDFYLPEFEVFIEVKPLANSVLEKGKRDEWEKKCASFRSTVGKAILIVYGDPAEDVWGMLFAWETDENGGGEFQEYARFVSIGEYYNPTVIIQTFGDSDETVCVTPDMTVNKRIINQAMMVDFYWQEAASLLSQPMTQLFNPDATQGTFDHMRKKARQARFEYGETPIVVKEEP